MIEEQAQDVDRDAGQVGAELDAGDDPHAKLVADLLRLGQAIGRVVVRERHGRDAARVRQPHHLAGWESTVGDERVEMEVERQRA